MTQTQTLPTTGEELKTLYNRDFATMQRKYRRDIDDRHLFSEPPNLPIKDITLQHLYNLVKFSYPYDEASKQILMQLQNLEQFETQQKQPSATVKKKTVLKEDKESVLKEIKVLKAEIAEKNKELDVSNSYLLEKEKIIAQLRTEQSNASIYVQTKQKEMDKLKSDLQTLQLEKASIQNRLQQTQTERTNADKSTDMQIRTLQTQHEKKLSEIDNRHRQDLQKLKTEAKDTIQTFQRQHETDILQTNAMLLELQTANEDLQTELEMLRKRGKTFLHKMKSNTFTVIGLLASIFYQGYHSQIFFASRATEGKESWENILISTFAAVAFSIAGFKLTLHTKNQFWIYGIATVDFLIYVAPKDWGYLNILGGFAIAISIVAYSHILNKEE